MQQTTLSALARARGLSQSDLARAAGVTRQRVSQWFRDEPEDGVISLHSKHLQNLAAALGVSVDELLHPLPLLGEAAAAREESAKLLWDRLYPDLVSFAADA